MKILFVLLLLWGNTVLAADNLTFKGDLIIPNCTVNGGAPLETDFGDIEIQKITTSNMGYYWNTLRVPVDCPYSSGIPKVKLDGNRGLLNRNAIKTSKYDPSKLVIFFRENDSSGDKIYLGSYQELKPNSVVGGGGGRRIILIAASVGVESGGVQALTPGRFTAAANMTVRYE